MGFLGLFLSLEFNYGNFNYIFPMSLRDYVTVVDANQKRKDFYFLAGMIYEDRIMDFTDSTWWWRLKLISQIIMEEVNGVTKNPWGESSDSNSTSNLQSTKYRTSNVGAGLSRASKFKGVVSQANGNWGAQIYANQQRIWLGTFKSETDAAMAYDSAAMKLRNGLTSRNFPWTNSTIREPSFQEQFSKELVLAMIKDGSYASKFSDYLRSQGEQGCCLAALHDVPAMQVIQLFQKELTPSDVGKLNRLVIPKKFALKYFPRIAHGEQQARGSVADVELVFFDRSMKSWNFRYCYWKSSQSFVFTRGWNSFAREKNLRAKDRIIFSSYECSGQKLCILDVAYAERARYGLVVATDDEALQLKLEIGEMEENVPSLLRKGLKLFGVQIMVQ